MKSLGKRLVAGVAGLVITTISALALAVTTGYSDGTVDVLEVSPGSVLVQVQILDSTRITNFVAQSTAPCDGVLESRSFLLTNYVQTAQSALLAGKPVRIYWSQCPSGAYYITAMDLKAR
jgi:hypothetical protein